MNKTSFLKRKAPYKKKQKVINDAHYTGPLKSLAMRRNQSTFKKYGNYTAACTSTVGGVVSSAFVVSPATLDDWGNLQKDWAEYRILGFQVDYVPYHQGSAVTGITDGILYMVIDRTSSTAALTSTQQAGDFEGCVYGCTNQRISQKAKASGANELAWVNMTVSSYWASIRTFSTALTASTGYGVFVVNIVIELRGAV
jgi:hypothetical protein